MAADETVLGDLHTKVATVLTELLDGQDLPTGEEDEDGNQIVQKLPPSAAILTASIQFLKNNNITCAPAEDNAMGILAEKIKEREAKRRLAKADLANARADMAFLGGLQ